MPLPFAGGLAVALVALLTAAPVSAKKTRPTPCPPGTFALDPTAAGALTQALGVATSTITVGDGRSLQLGDCPTTGRIRAKKKATVVAGRWKTCGTGAKVRLKATQRSPACTTFTGRIRAKQTRPVRFTATRGTAGPSTCGNGVVDPGEACETLADCAAGQQCTACACQGVYAPPSTSQSLIADALARGEIDYPTSLVYRAWALVADSRLPAPFDGEAWAHEDNALFREIAAQWDDFTPDVQAALRPFVTRPTEDGSYWHPGPPGFTTSAGEPASVECPYQPGGFAPDWRATATDHFVIWSCGNGDPGSDIDADKRTAVAAVAEQVYATMVPETGAPRGDDLATGPDPTSRIDVYLVTPRLCKSRPGGCSPIPLGNDGKPVLAAVAGTTPCSASASGGALGSASYMILDRERTPAAVPSGPSPFRYTFAHEFFHVIMNSLNLQAQGGSCPGGKPVEKVDTWLVEASAEWAAWAYFPADGPADRTQLFHQFQTRPAASVSLRSLAFAHPYEAFLYPFFVQQELGARTAVVDFWKSSGAARTPDQLETRLDGLLPFSGHFRDFSVRNLNLTAARLPGDPLPLAQRHQQQDAAIPENVTPPIQAPVTIDAPADLSRPAQLQALTAQYDHYTVADGARWVRIDANALSGAGSVQLDVIANVKGTWERRRLPGQTFEFCRDDAADDIGELYLVLTHHGRGDGQVASGTYEVRGRAVCPSGWSGAIRYLSTIDEHEATSGPSGIEIDDDHAREEQVWTVAQTVPAGEAGPYDRVQFRWNAGLTQDRTYQRLNSGGCVGQTVLIDVSARGTGSAIDQAEMRPGPGGAGWMPGPDIAFPQIVGTRVSYAEDCAGQSVESSEPIPLHLDQFAPLLAGVPGLLHLQAPNPADPNHFHGEHVLWHVEESRENGFFMQDARVTWALRRR